MLATLPAEMSCASCDMEICGALLSVLATIEYVPIRTAKMTVAKIVWRQKLPFGGSTFGPRLSLRLSGPTRVMSRRFRLSWRLLLSPSGGTLPLFLSCGVSVIFALYLKLLILLSFL